jgi:hypothetical protein
MVCFSLPAVGAHGGNGILSLMKRDLGVTGTVLQMDAPSDQVAYALWLQPYVSWLEQAGCGSNYQGKGVGCMAYRRRKQSTGLNAA